MWSKLSNALKPSRQVNDSDSDRSSAHSAPTDVLARVYEQHPNLSLFHDNTNDQDIPFPTPSRPSPPPSPSKQRKKSIRVTAKLNSDSQPSSLRLPIGLPKKVRSHLHLKSNSSQLSLSRNSSNIRPSSDTARPSSDTYRQHQNPSRPSLETPSITPSITLGSDGKFSSVRSILRDPKTPGTGQNVRFFSREASKVISPDASATTSEPSPISFADRLARAPRPSAMEVFSPPLLKDGLLHDTSNIFNMSPGHEVPAIPAGKTPLLDNAVELQDDAAATSSTPFKGLPELTIDTSFNSAFSFIPPDPKPPLSDEISIAPTVPMRVIRNRSRALSDTVFQSMLKKHAPEADINDTSGPSLVLAPEPDPFRANATTYYTPGTMIPPTPPQTTHSRTASREEDIIWSLRTQLAVQQELCAQYEIDLGARDELVQALTHRAEAAEKDKEKSRNVLRSWKKKAGELERMCRTLEDEVDTSRQESMERSIMDEASGEALRMLHRQISQLEHEKDALQSTSASQSLDGPKEHELRAKEDELREKDTELERLREEMKRRNDAEHTLHEGIRDTKEQIDHLTSHSVRSSMAEEALITAGEEERERHRIIELAWAEERERIVAAHEALHAENIARADELQHALQASADLERVSETLKAKEDAIVVLRSEFATLKAELEAQWGHTEKATENLEAARQDVEIARGELDTAHQESVELRAHVEELEGDNEALKTDLEAFEAKLLSIEDEWSEGENRRNELEAELVRTGEEHASRINELTAELAFASENVLRLEDNIKERDASITSLSSLVRSHADEVEVLREEISTLKVENSRSSSSHTRALQDLQNLEKDLRAQLEVALRERAESEIKLGTSKERVGCLMDEVARLRRTVHELQQESATRDVTIVQLRKERERDREDVNGLNIALDSKQQELELIKRKIAMKNSAATTSTSSTPATVRAIRRESMVGTPTMTSRPPSSMSDVSKDGKLLDTPSTAPRASISALNKSVRVNTMGKMGPPAPKATTRSSLATPTQTRTSLSASTSRTPSLLGKSTTTRPGMGATPRRVSTSSMESNARTSIAARRVSVSSSVPSEVDEKENLSATPTALKRPTSRRMVPT
ncbi:hypothetical protein M405DRAFT_832733 [Rhizopogon salebrosus TDB-379]|nr:hypothetical protein M405DRAFT_832733 [Rhizopogon salebrosus TDB-379]